MNEKILRLVGLLGVIIVIVNLVLFAFTIITPFVFWIILLLGAVLAYGVVPLLRKKN
ncbi:TPA: hypothetical protein HA241_05445 [Candidatus Woesearchaeota archaeon]|nr:hypothetical protein [Candidatus Woesearchaeota archaeon]